MKKLPFNLQFFAEEAAEQPENVDQNEMPTEDQTPKEDQKPTDEHPSEQDLLVRIAKLERSLDKASSEAATYKKKWKESLSEKEQADMEKAEAQARKDEEIEQIIRENKMFKSERKYIAMGWTPDEASKVAAAEADGDEDERIKLTAQVQARLVKEAVAKEIASRPDVNIGGGGNGNSYTKEQFDKMSLIEKSALKKKDEAEYNRLIAL